MWYRVKSHGALLWLNPMEKPWEQSCLIRDEGSGLLVPSPTSHWLRCVPWRTYMLRHFLFLCVKVKQVRVMWGQIYDNQTPGLAVGIRGPYSVKVTQAHVQLADWQPWSKSASQPLACIWLPGNMEVWGTWRAGAGPEILNVCQTPQWW